MHRRGQRLNQILNESSHVTDFPSPKVADPSLAIRFDDSKQGWDKFVSDINTALNPLDLEFRHLMDEQTGVEMFAVVRHPAASDTSLALTLSFFLSR